MKTLLLKNCYLISPEVEMDGASVYIEDKMIKKIFTSSDQLPQADEVIDCKEMMLMPGFVDVHCHGKANFDFCDASLEGLETIATAKLKEGVTTLLPTTLTLSEELLANALLSAKTYIANGEKGCKIPAVHLEGPFISTVALGAQNPSYVRIPDIEEVKRLNDIFPVKKVSFAPEAEGADVFSQELSSMGIAASAVHTTAKYAEFENSYDHGLRNISHFCNQMTGLHHRDIGVVGAGLLKNDVYIEIICDKLHLDKEMIRLIFTIKDVNYIQLITDAMRAAGMVDGQYDLGGLDVTVKDGEARLANGALAGSTLLLSEALKNVVDLTDLPLKELVKTTSYNQAKALNLEKIGKIEPLYYADLVVLDFDFKVQKTFVNGECKYSID